MGTGYSTPTQAPASPTPAPPSPVKTPPTSALPRTGPPAPVQLPPLVFTSASNRVSVDPTSAHRENRWRLEKGVHVCESKLQELAHTAWVKATPSAKASLSRSLQPYQRPLVAVPVKIDLWDVTMCRALLQNLGALANKDDATAVAVIVAARNHCAHAAGGLVTTAMFELHMTACVDALTTLDGDVAGLREIATCPIDSDLTVLTCSREATKMAELEKLQGNRLFIDRNLGGARDCYTRGIQVAGAVDPVVLSQLYNNRATVSIQLNELSAAKADAKHATELAPQWAKPHLRLAEIYKETYKPDKAVKRLEMALGYATAANDHVMVAGLKAKLSEYRLERDQAARRESENLAYGPSHQNEGHFRAANLARQGMGGSGDLLAQVDAITALDLHGTGMEAKKHVLLGQRATNDGRLADAAREFMAAAMAGDPEGMYNYALCQLKGRGTRKNIPEAVRWLEKAASMPIDLSPAGGKTRNVGIGEAMASLGNLYDGGVHFAQDKARARALWEQAADLDVNAGLNNFGLCLMNGSHGVKRDLPRARDLFRRSAETLHNEAMSNLGQLHASLFEFDTAARWADSAAKYGFPAAASAADEYRRLAKQSNIAAVPQDLQNALSCWETEASRANEPIDMTRTNKTPTLEQLRVIGTPYGDRLLAAKQLAMDSVRVFDPTDPDKVARSVALAVAAHRIDGGELVFSPEESYHALKLCMLLDAMGAPVTADVALLSKPTDASSAAAMWKSLQLQFPNDVDITKKAACLQMTEDRRRGVQLLQRTFTLLPKPHDDSDPATMDWLYLAGVAYFQTEDYQRGESLLTRFLQHAPSDGHRKAPVANYILGAIAMIQNAKPRHKPRKKAPSVTRGLAKFLHEGDRLLQNVPAFLRDDAEESPHRKMLQRVLNVADCMKNPRASQPPSVGPRRGGELIDGPRRHEALQCDTPSLQPKWRKEAAAMAAVAAGGERATHSWTNPPAQHPAKSTRNGGNYAPATIDELFSALEDRVCTGRTINCIVVSLPLFNGSSHHFVVEDSQREPARVAVYNAPPSLLSQLVPGREFQLRNPYVRLAQDGSIMLRVDNPTVSIEVNAVHTICWVCSLEQRPGAKPKRCAKCSKATYCSEQCQKHDWHNDGHRFMCKVVGKIK